MEAKVIWKNRFISQRKNKQNDCIVTVKGIGYKLEGDDHVVLISTAIAEKNALKLGDTITVQCCYDSGSGFWIVLFYKQHYFTRSERLEFPSSV